MDEISDNIVNEELDKLNMVKIQIREDDIWMSTSWRFKIWNQEIQITHYSSRNESSSLKDCSSWKILNGQIKVSERVFLRSELGMEDHLHQECYARSCREIVELRTRSNEEGSY